MAVEDGVDAVRGDDDRPGWDTVELHEVSLRALGHREYAHRAPDRSRNDEPKDRPVFPAHQRRVTLEREVVDGHNTRAGRQKWQGVLRMAEIGADVSERTWQRPGHAEILGTSPELDRLDPSGNEVGPARDCHEPNPSLGRQRRELAEQVADVGLVARPLAPEDVGVERDHPHVSSPHSSATESAARSHVNSRARTVADLPKAHAYSSFFNR